MKLFNLFLLVSALGFLSGCTTIKTMEATGGSRSEGVVELSYSTGLFESPQVDWAEAQRTATQRCQAWGYQGADPFSSPKKRCDVPDCSAYTKTYLYQCTGANF